MSQKKKEIKRKEKEIQENISNLEQEIRNKKQLPKEQLNKMNARVFENILIADLVMAFFYFITLGSLNIETPTFLMDLKVFSIGFVVFAILLFEVSYKKENGNIAIHGIEALVLALFLLFSIYIYTIYLKDFYLYVTSFSFLFAIYYVAKSIIVYQKMKKKYYASLNDINEIIKK